MKIKLVSSLRSRARSMAALAAFLVLVSSCGGGGGTESPAAREVPLFVKPFAGEYLAVNYFDHNTPREFTDSNGTFVIYTGEIVPTSGPAGMYDGHQGYDFLMPEGTPLLAVAAGTVVFVQDTVTPFFCPPLNATVNQQKGLLIEHQLPDGRRVRSYYTHLSRIDVSRGAAVSAGQQIGLSGNTGCSTLPHLHFEAYLVVGTSQVTIDPFGWSGSGTDPWEAFPGGAASIALWKAGEAPRLSRGFTYDLAAVAPFAPAYLTQVVFQGPRDDLNPNNEFLDLTIDTRVTATVASAGYALRFDRAGVTYTLPAGITLSAQNPTLRIYVGNGNAGTHTAYMGQSAGIISNRGDDCVRVLYPGGGEYRFNLGGCP
jgi:murein DD-endopeptidase MepM/ murein hydrolase activator NlpD